MGWLSREKQELLGVLLESFAFLHEHDEFNKRVLVDIVVTLNDQVSHDFA